MSVFEDFKIMEEYMKKYPPVEPIGIKVIIEKGEIVKFLQILRFL